MRILAATRNAHKAEEIAEILRPLGVEVVGPEEQSGTPDVEETGDSFEANALLKARAAAAATGMTAFADDSGLEVDALGGEPGVLSARYAGPGASDAEKRALVLARLADVRRPEDRTARFRCAAALASPDGWAMLFTGSVEGLITFEPRGEGGFGYDPIFFFPPFGKTFAEVPRERKNAVSHRGRAFRTLAQFLRAAGACLSAGEAGERR